MAGDTSLDVLHHKAALVKKPCMDKARAPQLGDGEQFCTGEVMPIAAFDQKNDRLFIAGSDSIVIYDLQNTRDPWTRLAVDHENILRGSQGIYDPLNRKII